MEILKTKENENDNYYSISYLLTEDISVESLIEIGKQFEKKMSARMTRCCCESFDDEGYPLTRIYDSLESIKDIKKFANPYINFSLEFTDLKTRCYKFNIDAETNSNTIIYSINKKIITEMATHTRK